MAHVITTFSIDDFDLYGDVLEGGVFLHFNETRIKVADSLEDFKKWRKHLKSIEREIEENYAEII